MRTVLAFVAITAILVSSLIASPLPDIRASGTLDYLSPFPLPVTYEVADGVNIAFDKNTYTLWVAVQNCKAFTCPKPTTPTATGYWVYNDEELEVTFTHTIGNGDKVAVQTWKLKDIQGFQKFPEIKTEIADVFGDLADFYPINTQGSRNLWKLVDEDKKGSDKGKDQDKNKPEPPITDVPKKWKGMPGSGRPGPIPSF